MKFVRWFLGRIILLLNFIFTPRSKKREAQKRRALSFINLKHVLSA